MEKKVDAHVFAGMQKDMAISKHKNEFLYDAYNIRFTPMEGNTMLSITNERGPKYQLTCSGKYVGHCVIDKYLVIFTKSADQSSLTPDRIVRYEPNNDNDYNETVLYEGNLNFSTEYAHQLETLGVYENENIIKVYWVDGLNQPRVINITDDGISRIKPGLNTQFDFIQTLELKERVTVERTEGTGIFEPGVIQYAFTYYNLYGPQSNIFYTTPLNYISYIDRGGEPGKKVSNTFNVKIEGVDKNFDYIRIYSIYRSSLNGTPVAKRVVDLDVSKSVDTNEDSEHPEIHNWTLSFSDDGTIGDSIDQTLLLYIGGEELIPNTITDKDNVLFIGNYELKRSGLNYLREPGVLVQDLEHPIHTVPREIVIEKTPTDNRFYTYTNTLKYGLNGFKNREHYRLGVQFQHESGRWSDPIFIEDFTVGSDLTGTTTEKINPDCVDNDNYQYNRLLGIDIHLTIDNTSSNNARGAYTKLIDDGYKRARAVCVFPEVKDRLVLTQGILCPTVYGIKDRYNKAPFAQSSWFFRPTIPDNIVPSDTNYNIYNQTDFLSLDVSACAEFRHNYLLPPDGRRNTEVQGSSGGYLSTNYSQDSGETSGSWANWSCLKNLRETNFAVDQSILTFHSPDIEFDTDVQLVAKQDWKMRLVGFSNFTAAAWDTDIKTSTPTAVASASGFKRITGVSEYPYQSALLSAAMYQDAAISYNDTGDSEGKKFSPGAILTQSGYLYWLNYIINPWHRSGSLNNDEVRPASEGQQTSVLKTKVLSNLKFSKFNTWFDAPVSYDITSPELFDSDEISLLKIPFSDNSLSFNSVSYYGNYDNVLSLYDYIYYVYNAIGSSSETTASLSGYQEVDPYSSIVNGNTGGGDPGSPEINDEPSDTPPNPSNPNPNPNPDPNDPNDDPSLDADEDSRDEENPSNDQPNGVLQNKVAVRMSYKSTKHFVLSLKTDEHRPVILPVVNDSSTLPEVTKVPWWLSEEPNVKRNGAYQVECRTNPMTRYNPLSIVTMLPYTAEDIEEYHLDVGPEGEYKWIISEPDPVTGDNVYTLDPNYKNKYVLVTWGEDISQEGITRGRIAKILAPEPEMQSHICSYYIIDTSNRYFCYQENAGQDIDYYKGVGNGFVIFDIATDENGVSTIFDGVDFTPERANIEMDEPVAYPYLFLAELYRDALPTDFGGNSEQVMQQNIWLPAGEPIDLNPQLNEINLHYIYGDSWYQRYDCLKTYAYSEEHENSIVEIGSFMCESRINIDGRYDRNRGQINNLNMSPVNFNKLNEVYTQKNNFFSYNILPNAFYSLDRFPNSIYWSLPKTAGEEIDAWTQVALASTFDFDGTKGEITALRTYNDNIICFQDNSLSYVLFNSRVQIPTTDGVPIEISNSGKMDGKRAISDTIGCSNKWSIKNTPNALYFLDSNSKKLYAFTDKLQTISDTHGFDHHFKSIEHFDSEKTFYDPIRQDLYLVWDKQCLVWSELLGQFTSFMSYEGVPAMFSIGDTFYCLHYTNVWRDNQWVQVDSGILLYKMFAGAYNRFFGYNYKPVRLIFISNPEGSTDKIFSTLGARLDIFQEPIYDNGNWDTSSSTGEPEESERYLFNPKHLEYDAFFDYIRVTNEYQDTGEVILPQSWFAPASHGFNKDYNPKKKFRMWRVDIPRDKDRKLDRIRNTWAKIELGFIPPVMSSNSPSNQTLLDYASSHGINDFSIDLYREGLYEESGLAGYYTEHHSRSTPSSLTDAQKQYYRKHLVLHDLDVQYFI